MQKTRTISSTLILFIAFQALGFDFKADHYTRDAQTNTIQGRGNAWVKIDSQEIFADEMDADLNANRVYARGNVRIIDKGFELWGKRAEFSISNPEARIEEGNFISGQSVIEAQSIERLDQNTFEVKDGIFTNCNLAHTPSANMGECSYAWKIQGRRFHVTMGGYAHVYDAVVFGDKFPVLYLPYIAFPMKAKRETGLIQFSFVNTGTLQTSLQLPFFWAINEWSDFTIQPSYFPSVGFHVANHYRYRYSPRTFGDISWFFTERRFSPDRANPGPDNTGRARLLGFIGEGSANIQNQVALWGRAHSRQTFRYISNPFYTFDYAADVNPQHELGYLRSQIFFTQPTDKWLFFTGVQHHQSLIVSKDTGVDRGSPTRLPVIGVSKTTEALLDKYVSVEFDAEFNHFYRPEPFDRVPTTPSLTGDNTVNRNTFTIPDYVRGGKRLQLEPRLLFNVPVPDGFQFQPMIRAGTLLYQFSVPTPSTQHREYLTAEFPLTMYISKTFSTSIPGFERVNHVIQPRFLYALSAYQSPASSHPFFYREVTGLSNPRFDLSDELAPFEYARFELIQRFRRKSDTEVERFWLIQLSQNLNRRTVATDPRFRTRLGPVELLSELRLWRFSAQAQGIFQLEVAKDPTGAPTNVREHDVSLGLEYRYQMDRVVINTLIRRRLLKTDSDKVATLSFYKTLPVFFDLEGSLEYSLVGDGLRAYSLGFNFYTKPARCWALGVKGGRNAFGLPFVFFNFALDFGRITRGT